MGSVAKNLALWIAYLRRCAARCWWPMESKACDQSKKRIYREVDWRSNISVSRLKTKSGVDKERSALKPYWLGWRRWSMEWERRCWIIQGYTSKME